MTKHYAIAAAILAAAAAGACKPKSSGPPPQMPPVPIQSALATAADVPVYRDYPGITTAVQMVEINARVEGWVTDQKFTDGQMVQEGMLLYEIDPKPFEVALEQATANLAVAEAEYRNAHQKVERNRPLVDVQAISAEQFDTMVANERSTKALTEARRAAVDQARLDLSYCSVHALATGQISRTQVYKGTLVGPSVNNRMTNIQVLDPIWVEFNPVAQDIPALRGLLETRTESVAVTMPPGAWARTGRVVFIDNHVDPTTDTILARLQLPNKDLSLVPGAYVSVRLPVQLLKDAVTVPETAIVFQTAAALVWTVQADGTAHSAVVQTGPKGGSGIVVTHGLKAGERVITQGQQKLRDGATVAEAKSTAETNGEKAAAHSAAPPEGAGK